MNKFLQWALPIGLMRLGFDGGGGGGSPAPTNTTSTTQVQNFGPEEQANRDALQTEAKRIYEATKGQFATYPGAQIAGPSAATQAAEASAGATAQNLRANVSPNIQDALNYNLTAAKDVNSNPFLKGAMDAAVRPMNENFTQAGGTLSQIRTAAGNAEQGGGTRQGIAEGIAQRGLTNAIGDVTSRIGSDAYKTGLDASTKAIVAAPIAQSAIMQPTTIESALGSQQDLRAQQELNRESDATQWQMNADWIPLNNYANMIYGGGSSGGTTTSNTPTYQAGGGGGASPLSTLGSVAGIGSSIATMTGASF